MTTQLAFIGGLLFGMFGGFIIGGAYEATKWYTEGRVMKVCPFSFNHESQYVYCHNGMPAMSVELAGRHECMAWCSIPGYCKLIGRDE